MSDVKCTYDPREMAGLPVGMFHCPECGEMVIAGLPHPDYDDIDALARAEANDGTRQD